MFEIDLQTINDLRLFTKGLSEKSVFDFFNKTKTVGGKLKLEFLMNSPHTNLKDLEKRQNVFRHYSNKKINFNVTSSQLNYIEHYLALNTVTLKRNRFDNFFFKNFSKVSRNDLFLIETGIDKIFEIILLVQSDINYFFPFELQKEKNNFEKIVSIPEVKFYINNKKNKVISYYKIDYLFRVRFKEIIRKFIDSIYFIDAYISVAYSKLLNRLSFPELVNSDKPVLNLVDLRHPLINDPVYSNFSFKDEENVCFLTGPNMAGKSTFLKSLGIALYLAHLGFPVLASKMKVSIFNGMYSSININDNVDFGYSHFYSEVKRIKDIALKIRKRKNVIVIIDEMFRGTNFVDAIEASSRVIIGFSNIKSSLFFISTHIVEIKSNIEHLNGIVYKCFDVKWNGITLKYDYLLKNGLSETRVGFYILEKEGVLKILEKPQ